MLINGDLYHEKKLPKRPLVSFSLESIFERDFYSIRRGLVYRVKGTKCVAEVTNKIRMVITTSACLGTFVKMHVDFLCFVLFDLC